ncbi:uncharacterized protein LOC143447396 isoform X1 [Clavelina lepadiformis]|uniref:uncharacterized protein LOC143447396 isoform X1 n=1 Tax=Clavelina lepadiformis TaxID=159417 RepID=UPI0040431E80
MFSRCARIAAFVAIKVIFLMLEARIVEDLSELREKQHDNTQDTFDGRGTGPSLEKYFILRRFKLIGAMSKKELQYPDKAKLDLMGNYFETLEDVDNRMENSWSFWLIQACQVDKYSSSIDIAECEKQNKGVAITGVLVGRVPKTCDETKGLILLLGARHLSDIKILERYVSYVAAYQWVTKVLVEQIGNVLDYRWLDYRWIPKRKDYTVQAICVAPDESVMPSFLLGSLNIQLKQKPFLLLLTEFKIELLNGCANDALYFSNMRSRLRALMKIVEERQRFFDKHGGREWELLKAFLDDNDIVYFFVEQFHFYQESLGKFLWFAFVVGILPHLLCFIGITVVMHVNSLLTSKRFEKQCNRIWLNDKQENIDSSGYEQEKCTICWEKFAPNQYLCQLACNHLFHRDCVKRWFVEVKFNCPVCRRRAN